jgi:hypothetical protein
MISRTCGQKMASQGYKGLLIGFGSPRNAGSLEQKRQTSPRKLLVQRTKIENLHDVQTCQNEIECRRPRPSLKLYSVAEAGAARWAVARRAMAPARVALTLARVARKVPALSPLFAIDAPLAARQAGREADTARDPASPQPASRGG